MSIQGPDIEALAQKYTSDEKRKFNQIIEADNSGDAALAEQLAGKLNPAENQRFDEYLADLEKIQQYKEQLAAQMARNKAKIDDLDGKIVDAEQRRAAILTQYEDGMSKAVGSFAAQQGHNSTSSANISPKNDKKGGCYIQ